MGEIGMVEKPMRKEEEHETGFVDRIGGIIWGIMASGECDHVKVAALDALGKSVAVKHEISG